MNMPFYFGKYVLDITFIKLDIIKFKKINFSIFLNLISALHVGTLYLVFRIQTMQTIKTVR